MTTIRPITPADAPAFRDLRIEALRLHPLAFTADLAEAEERPFEWWSDSAGRSTGDGTQVIMLADAGERGLAGMTGVYVPPQPKLAHVGIIWGVYVREPFRGRGLGSSLLRACIDWARGKGLIGLKLGVAATNDDARRCYERCGFTAYGLEPNCVQWEGRLYDEILMALRLKQ